jgi:hypothetical protein
LSQIKIHKDLPQEELPQREERLRKTFLVFLCSMTFLKARLHTENKEYMKKYKRFQIKILRISSRRASTERRKA